MRLVAYGALSTSLAAAVILTAFQQRPNFYSACVYLSQSNASLMCLTNMGVFLTILLGHITQRIFFGHLRAIEEAHLRERTWFAVTETFLAMTVFRDEFNTRFVVMFVSLLFVKCFHWICHDRIDYMEQFPSIPASFHVRMVPAILLFLGADIAFISHAIDVTIRQGASMMIMFGFEFILLAATMTAIFVKYVLNVIDSRHTEAWENRSIYMFYLELATDFFKLLTYLAFFSIILTYYGLPLHIIRDVYITLRSFARKLMSFIRYRQATAHMNERYPDATVEELEATGDRTCIICREQMVHGGENGRERTRPKKLRCGHILHFHCLRSWLERQQSCPTCRRPVLDETPTRPPLAPRLPAPQPPFIDPRPIPIHIPGQADRLAPPAPGPMPAAFPGAMPRLVTGATITLPPGFVLPPGWAVIPAHNVQLVPAQPGLNPAGGAPATPVVADQAGQNMPGGQRVQGTMPSAAGTPIGNGDVTIPVPTDQIDHAGDSGPTTIRSDNFNTNTNTPDTSTSSSTNTTQPTNNPGLSTTNIPTLMQRSSPRNCATQSPCPAFPVVVHFPSIPTQGNVSQFGSPTSPQPALRADGLSPSNHDGSSRANGVMNTSSEKRDLDERTVILQEMGETAKAMQSLVTRLSSLLPAASQTSSSLNLPLQPQIPPSTEPLPSSSNSVHELSSSNHQTSNGHSNTSSPPNSPPQRHHQRRHTSDGEPHPADRIHRLSSSEEEFSPDEIDIRAPWVEDPNSDPEFPLIEARHSPPRRRSGSQSPARSLRRRGSLLKNDITNDVLDERRQRKSTNSDNIDGETEVGASLDKGKGKEVYVEDEPQS